MNVKKISEKEILWNNILIKIFPRNCYFYSDETLTEDKEETFPRYKATISVNHSKKYKLVLSYLLKITVCDLFLPNLVHFAHITADRQLF